MEEQIQNVRNKLIDKGLIGLMIFIFPALIISVSRIIEIGWNWIYFLHFILAFAAILIYIYRSILSVEIKTHCICTLFLILCFTSSLKFGISAGGSSYLVPITLSTLIFGKRTGFVYFIISITGLYLITVIQSFKIIQTDIDFNVYNHNLTTWLNLIFTLTFIMLIVIYSIGQFYKLFTQNIKELLEKSIEQEISQQELKKSDELLKEQNEELTALNKEYRNAKEKAQENEKYIRLIANNLDNCMIYQVVILDENQRRFTYISDTISKFFGCTAEEAIANADLIYGRIHHEDIARVQKEEIQALNKMSVFKTEMRSIGPNGNTRWVQLISSPRLYNGLIYWDGIEIDITQQKIAEREREELLVQVITARDEEFKAKELLNSIMERVSDGIVAFDADFNYNYVNTHGGDLLSRKPDDLTGKNYWIEYPEARNTPFANAYVRAMETQQPIFFEDYYVHWDRWFVNRIYPSKEGITIFFSDITARKKAEAEIIAAKEKAEKNEKVLLIKNEEYEALNEELKQTNEELNYAKEKAEESDSLKTAFLLNMSHEIRTPMNSINGFTQMLIKPDLSDEKRKKFSSIIINSSKQLQSIVDDILTISTLETKQEKIILEPVNLNFILSELHTIFKLQAESKQISLFAKPQLTDNQSEIFTDKTKTIQILSNLIGNAIKFTQNGFVEFGYELIAEKHGRESLQSIQFYVKDSGIGINPEMQTQIFERFVQVETGYTRLFGGNGLGLSISKGFVELLGGRIWVESEPENGSSFYFTIPYNPCLKLDNTISTTKNAQLKTVLVAEDEENNYLFIEELLIDMNLRLIHAKNGQETVEICKSNPNIDLILMDIKMPIMDGNVAAKKIKEFRPDLKIIAQSAYTFEQYREKYHENVFDDYTEKPINEIELKQKVMKYFDK